MKTDADRKNPRKWILALLIAITFLATNWALFNENGYLKAQAEKAPPRTQTSKIFTTAHASPASAVKHFFGILPRAVQPVAYQHKPHIEKAKLECNFCHVGVDQGPVAGIPGVTKCMECHEVVATENPVIQQVTAYRDRGEDIPWQRVYGWVEEAHVRFNHAPHIRAEVSCATCHGDVANMTVAERVVNHSMGFCITCHQEKKVSNDCLTCHY